MGKGSKTAEQVSDLLRVPAGPVDLGALDTRATPGFDGGKQDGKAALADLGARLSDLQERLHAEGVTGGTRSLLLVLQGMDTSGKGGLVRHVIGQVDPQGCAIASFKAPTREELAHDFLWRIRRRLPRPGQLGVFDRSHYEDVLVVRVHELVPRSVWSRRYATINRFEARLAEREIRVVKVFLHISEEEQRRRLLARLDDPTKHWKFNPRDVDERAHWGRPGALQQRPGALVPDPGRPQVVPELGGRQPAGGAARGPEADLAEGRLRRRRAAGPPAGGCLI
jgi:PPK2 family polyphosphate:nucleotide phosphotransferase